MSDIVAKIFKQDAKYRNRTLVREAGFVVYNPESGKNLDATVYPTEDAAQAAIPGILTRYAERVAAQEARAAEAERVLAEAATPTQSRDARGTYRTVHSSLYGEGRVFSHTPGATQYDSDGSGRYSTQIWDND